MFSLFGRPKPCRIITTLRDSESNWHLSKIAKTSDTTYVYVTKLISRMQENGLVNIEVKGKKRMVRLTEKGVGIANLVHELRNKLDGPE
jgi:predicted transcriptional regulator